MILNPRVEQSPQRSPGCCHSCGAGSESDREWFLDCDMDESDSPGIAIILCNICFELLAGPCGYELQGNMARATKLRIEELERQVDEFSELGNTLRFFGLDLDNLTNMRRRCEMADGGILPEGISPSSKISSGTSKSGSGSKGSVKSSDDEAVGDVRTSKSNTALEL